ncbi:uncharacterized protein DNG_10319 [Cephalotrichum gorgonifer]|uniref:Ankyrin repeat domain-containing protein n=1 Tax=Cephalotrichum gorgonifer TaxID=2041049 RepID=A0AAE8N8M5_9PEZI|nr:uncharacterized protein DNG_10319 [Cephalotrichum gorgonifer]
MDDIWIEDETGLTAFDLVVKRGKVEDVEEFIRLLENTAGRGKAFEVGRHFSLLVCQKARPSYGFCLKRGWECNGKDNAGATLLDRVIEYEFLEGVEVLLQKRLFDIKVQNSPTGDTVLHYARSAEAVKLLLNAGATIDGKNKDGQTPLFWAAYLGCTGVVEELLNSTPKPDVKTQDAEGSNILHVAFDRPDIMALMVKHGVDLNALNNGGRTPLGMASWWNDVEGVKFLLGAGANPNGARAVEISPLFTAIRLSNTSEIFRLLVKNGAELLAQDSRGITALRVAVEYDKRYEAKCIAKKMKDRYAEKARDIYASVLH